jgi:hypothetical protein
MHYGKDSLATRSGSSVLYFHRQFFPFRNFAADRKLEAIMTLTTNAAWLICFMLAGCASAASTGKSAEPQAANDSRVFTASAGDDARQVIGAIPPESVMERFHMADSDGRIVSYVAFTDTDVGGLVFVDRKLLGTVSKHDAQAFYDCRGYATTMRHHWASQASEWIASLLAETLPVDKVTLRFSGDSTPRSIREVNRDQTEMLLSLLNFSVNPLNILKKLNAARENLREREQYRDKLQALTAIVPGDSEARVAETLEPEEVFFGESGLVMAYPGYAYEFYVSAGVVKVAQQPSFYRVSRSRSALFYAPGMKWEACTPEGWKNALPAPMAAAVQAAK